MKNYQLIFLVVLVMCCINFFDLQSIKGSSFRLVQFGVIIVAILLSIPGLFVNGSGFIAPVQLLVGSIVLSLLIAVFTRGQSVVDSFIGSVPVLVWSLFFYLRRIGPSIRTIERIILGYGLLYLVLYFFQFTHPTSNYFVDLEVVDDSRGILRMVFPGRGLFYLMVFMAITKINITGTNKWVWISLAVVGLVVTVMQVTRQFIFGAVLIYLIHFLKDLSVLKKVFLVGFAVVSIYFILQTDNPIVTGLRDTQEQTKDSGSDYIRLQTAVFFLNDFSDSFFNRVFGNGVPYGSNSPYYHFYKYYVDNYGYWLSDVGLVAIYAMFGVLAVVGYLLIWLKSFTIPLPKPYMYLKYYLWFLLITSFTSDTIYSPNDLIATVMVIYSYQVIYEWMKVMSSTMKVEQIHPPVPHAVRI